MTEPFHYRRRTEQGDGTWRLLANCRGLDPALFYPERGEATREARQVCAGCEVRVECLEYALANGEKNGLWGGKSERERRRMRRDRATPLAQVTRPCPVCRGLFVGPLRQQTCSRRCARILQHRRTVSIPKMGSAS